MEGWDWARVTLNRAAEDPQTSRGLDLPAASSHARK